MPGAKLVELDPGDIPAVARLLGLAYRDNPLTIALLGDDSETRLRVGERIHAIRIAAMEAPIVVRVGNEIVGVYGLEPPGSAPMSPEQQRQMLAALSDAGSGVLARAQEMLGRFAKYAPTEGHWKLGPVAVAPHLHGSSIGSRMVEHFCARIDALGSLSCLDTDQVRNVRLYERYGFEVVAEAPVLGVPMWFMARRTMKGL
ncbi:MAG: GNAT family N-acetyltransferase [Dehalococcoidia bacterium]